MVEKARVFISCGQRKDTDEVPIAKSIAASLETMGFDAYIAVEEQTLKGLKENILARLAQSEYLIFIDFSRERLFQANDKAYVDTGLNRGSLFSHQELAIASYLDVQVLAFQEKGNKKDDGVLGFIQANCIPFTDLSELPRTVMNEVRKKNWDSSWRNELRLERDSDDRDDNVLDASTSRVANYFHIKVRNLHRSKIARDCVVYLERIVALPAGTERSPDLVELKWKGVTSERVAIPPRSYRRFDAFHVYVNDPTKAHLGLNPFIVDFTGYSQQYQLNGPGQYELWFVVFSTDFAPARAMFKLTVGSKLISISLNQSA